MTGVEVALVDVMIGHLLAAAKYAELRKEKGGKVTLADLEGIENENANLLATFKRNLSQ